MTAAADNLASLSPPPQIGDSYSLKQLRRRCYPTPLPPILNLKHLGVETVAEDSLLNTQDIQNNSPHVLDEISEAILKQLFQHTYNVPFYKIVEAKESVNADAPMNVGVVLSGGQAAGGHNVICGIFDFIKRINPSSRLYGFLAGPHGVYSGEYTELNKETIDKYRNMGGFDMIKSGRHKIETEAQKLASLEVCEKLNLNGLVIIGGDDSNTNAAIMSEYFKAKGSKVCVVGCPKTIDGDLKNQFVEISFGFDTACRVYSCSIGSLMFEALTHGDSYRFVRLMGRSASLVTLECALQTHPNLTFIGEEVLARRQTLNNLVDACADLIEERWKAGKAYGVVCLPEGLIEFIPEVGCLIEEINSIVTTDTFNVEKLTEKSKTVFTSLPASTQRQLLLDRDPHGNVQVALIETESLLLEMTRDVLKKRNFDGPFKAKCFYFGYEGRSGFPSDFDASYCYALGNVAGCLVQNKVTSCMAVLKDMSCSKSVANWKPAGIPLVKMMNLETRKGKSNVPVIKKFLVDINKPLFKAFTEVRDKWRVVDYYRMLGPMQFEGADFDLPYTLTGPPEDSTQFLQTHLSVTNVQSMCIGGGGGQSGGLEYFAKVGCASSPLLARRLDAPLSAMESLGSIEDGCMHFIDAPGSKQLVQQQQQQILGKILPKSLSTLSACGSPTVTVRKGKPIKGVKVGIVLLGESVPGLSNVLFGLNEKLLRSGGELYGFFGARGILNNEYIKLNNMDLAKTFKNIGGFGLLGRTMAYEADLYTPDGVDKLMTNVVDKLKLDVLVMLGCSYIESCIFSEYIQTKYSLKTLKIVNVCGSADFTGTGSDPSPSLKLMRCLYTQMPLFKSDVNLTLSDATVQQVAADAAGLGRLGFDTQTKVASELIGNLSTDCNSAVKYYYFCKIGGGRGAEVEVAFQSHANICLLSHTYSKYTLFQISYHIADWVQTRCAKNKNFGILVLNKDFFVSNKHLRRLAVEIFTKTDKSPESTELYNSLPDRFQKRMEELFNGDYTFIYAAEEFPILDCLAEMVSGVIATRKSNNCFPKEGSFNALCFNLVDSIRGSIPSAYDCSLGYNLGVSTGIFCTSPDMQKMRSTCVLIGNSSSSIENWQPLVVPLCAAAVACGGLGCKEVESPNGGHTNANSSSLIEEHAFDVYASAPSLTTALSVVLQQQQGYCFYGNNEIERTTGHQWLMEDSYINSGPLQFTSNNPTHKHYHNSPSMLDLSCNFLLSAKGTRHCM